MQVIIYFELDTDGLPGIDFDDESAVYDYLRDMTHDIRSDKRVKDYREEY